MAAIEINPPPDVLPATDGLDRERIGLERERLHMEHKWKILSAVGVCLGGLLTFVGTRALNGAKQDAVVDAKSRSAQSSRLTLPKNDLDVLRRMTAEELSELLAVPRDGTQVLLGSHRGLIGLPPRYQALRRLADLGLVEFDTHPVEFDVLLKKLQAETATAGVRGWSYFSVPADLAVPDGDRLKNQSYRLSESGRNAVRGLTIACHSLLVE